MTKSPSRSLVVGQAGNALLVVLVLLAALAWFALSGFRISGQHLQIVGNSQARSQALAAAQRGIDQTISSNLFSQNPDAVAATPIATDIDGDGIDDYTATLTPKPKCYRVRPIKTAELNIALATDKVCLKSSGPGGTTLIEKPGTPSTAGDSLCAASEWNVAARVNDATSETLITVQQGVAIRVAEADADTFCK